MIRVPSILDLLAQGLSDGLARFVIRVCDQRYVRRRPAVPGISRFVFRQVSIDSMRRQEATAYLLKPTDPSDVARRTLGITSPGLDPITVEADLANTEPETGDTIVVVPGYFDAGQVLTVVVTDYDLAGNPTASTPVDVTVLDQTGPAVPGGVRFVFREVEV